ncbi:MAG TPA: SMP-30/gluconolactonase/LRE family protein [Puia sp.]|nr:SMP-30/gluconolactonase/LRE family protein [Puia sp.]
MEILFDQCNVAYAGSNLLGEGPVWDDHSGCLYWVDIEDCHLFEMKWPSKTVRRWKLPQLVGMVALQKEHNLIVALQEGLAAFDVQTAELHWLADIEKDLVYNRANDGKCDAKGRLWLGTMNFNCTDPTGSLYMINEKLAVRKKLDELTISNGMAWPADHKHMYFIDSATYKVDAFHFDLETGKIEFEKTAIRIPVNLGMPDGMTIDNEGMLWIAHWNGFAVRRWDPATGDLLASLPVPAPQVTSITFGGENLDEAFITTAKTGLTTEQLAQYPLSGHLFTCRLPYKGMAADRFKPGT